MHVNEALAMHSAPSLITEHVCAMHKAHVDEERPAVAERIVFESIRQALKNDLD